MAATPWRPPGLLAFGKLPLSVGITSGAALEETRVQWSPSYRIVTSEYPGENLFDRLADASELTHYQNQLDALREIADLTNPHVLNEAGRIELIRPEDRLYGLGSGLIMAAFAFPGKPSRFSDGLASTYYASRTRDTAIVETCYHDEIILHGSGPSIIEKTLIHAELDATLLDLRNGRPCPLGLYDHDDYSASQAFGGLVRHLEGYGIAYDSMRHQQGECVAIFRPPALHNAQAMQTLYYHWDGNRISAVK